MNTHSVTVHRYLWLSNKNQKLHERAIQVFLEPDRTWSLWSAVVWKSGACTSVRAVITSHRTHNAGRFSTMLHFQTLDGCREKDGGLHTFLHWFIFIFTHAVRHHRSLPTRGCMGKMSTWFQIRLEWCKYLWYDLQRCKDDAGQFLGRWRKIRNF